MPNFISTADIHIQIKKDVPKDWQISRYLRLFDELIELCYQNSAYLTISGDLMDSVEPTVEEVELFLVFMGKLQSAGVKAWVTSGNHETKEAGKSVLDHLMAAGFHDIVFRPHWNVNHQGVSLHLLDHDSLEVPGPPLEPSTYNVLLTHARCNLNQFVREEVDIEALCSGYDLCILGDIHEPLQLSDRIFYTNNPVNDRFEASPDNGVLLVKIDPVKRAHTVERISLNYLPQLVYRKCDAADWPLEFNEKDFYKVEVAGTPEELREVRCKLPNVKLVPVPLVLDVLATEEQTLQLQELETQSGDLEAELGNYLQALQYLETRQAQMLDLYREVNP